MVGRRAYERKSCREVHAVFARQSLERRESLVMIHGEHAVVMTVGTGCEKYVG